MKFTNEQVGTHAFLADMYADSYFPKAQVDKVKAILHDLCVSIEQERPGSPEQLLRLTHAATERINGLAEEFEENGSELETAAREAIAADFGFVAEAYGFGGIDIEDLIEPRDW